MKKDKGNTEPVALEPPLPKEYEERLKNAEHTLAALTDDFGTQTPAYLLSAYGPRYYYFKGDL